MTKYLLFGGKGGVGKTTCAAATALRLAKQGHKTLVVSTDPAHSLADSFEIKIGSKEKEIAENLSAIEIDPKEGIEKLKEKLGEQKPELPENPLGGAMPGMDLGALMGGLGDLSSMPGMDEMAAFNKFLQYIDNSEYEYVVFDTAPTGHTLKFLSLPEVMDSWVGKMLKVRIQMSNAMNMFKQLLPFTEHKENDRSLAEMEKMKAQIEKGKQVLANPKLTEFNLVMLPQEMSIAESERAKKQLEEYGIPVHRIIVNQVQPEHKSCEFCSERREMHEKKLKEIRERFAGIKIIETLLDKDEITGIKKLKGFSKKLF